MNKKSLQSNLLLLLTAAIWGFAFVAQRVSTEHIGAFTFNGVRFALGALSLLPLLFIKNKFQPEYFNKNSVRVGFLVGIFLFLGSTFQQLGIVGISSGKAAFITGTYVILVPLLGILLGNKVKLTSFIAAF